MSSPSSPLFLPFPAVVAALAAWAECTWTGGPVLLPERSRGGDVSRWQRVEKTRKSADTEPVGRRFGSGFVPAGSGAGTTSDPTGIF